MYQCTQDVVLTAPDAYEMHSAWLLTCNLQSCTAAPEAPNKSEIARRSVSIGQHKPQEDPLVCRTECVSTQSFFVVTFRPRSDFDAFQSDWG